MDAVGVVESKKVDPQTMDRKRGVPFDKLLEQVALGVRDDDTLTTLAGRLAQLRRKLTPQDELEIEAASGGLSLRDLANQLLDAVDPDQQLALAQEETGQEHPTAEQVAEAAGHLAARATAPFDDARLRTRLIAVHERSEQLIDTRSVDQVLGTGFSDEQARATVDSFRAFLEANRDEIAALQIIYSQPYARQRLTYEQVKELAERLELPPNAWTTESLWRAYAQLERDRVRGVGAQRVLADLVSLVRHAVLLDDELVPYPERVGRRYEQWLAAQQEGGRSLHRGAALVAGPDCRAYRREPERERR